MTKQDIAIIGGAFNPVHNGHIEMVKYLSKNYIVDKIYLMPTYNSPYKKEVNANNFIHRLNMLTLATSKLKNINISTFEKDYSIDSNTLYNYTFDTLNEYNKCYLNINIYLVVGFDSIKSIKTWKNYEELIKNNFFYVFDREDDKYSTLEKRKNYLKKLKIELKNNLHYEYFDFQVPNISSTELRELFKDKIKNKEKILNYIDLKVYNYIVSHKLYEN